MDSTHFAIPVRGSSDFETRYWDAENIPILDKTGKVELILLVVTDVTQMVMQEKRNEQLKSHNKAIETGLELSRQELVNLKVTASKHIVEKNKSASDLAESEKKYKYLFENNQLPTVIWDFSTLQIIDCNEEALAKYGYEKKEFLQLNMKEIMPAEDISLLEAAVKNEETYGDVYTKTWRHKKKNGELMFMEAHGRLIHYNKSTRAALVMLNDITDKLAGEALNETDRLNNQALINSTEDLIWSVSPDLKLIAANHAFIHSVEASSGITLKPGDDLLISHIFPEDFLVFWKTCYQRALSGESFTEEVYTPDLKKRKTSWTETTFNPIIQKDEVVAIACYSKNITERKSGEDKLRQSELRLTNAQAVAKIGSWETVLSSLQVIWSKETFKIFDIDPGQGEIPHPNFLAFVHPDDVEKVDIAFKNSLNDDALHAIEHRIVTPTGLQKIVEERWHIVCNDQGQPVRAVGTCQDITERKAAQDALMKAHDEKNTVLESIDDGFFAINSNSLVTYWNRKAEILLGEKREDTIGRNLHEMFASPGSRVFYDNYQKAIREKSTVHFEGFSNRANKWFSVSAFGSANGLSVYFKDVTGRKNSEDKIKESELRYRSIIEQATDAICIADSSMKIIDINPQGCQMLGYSKAEFFQLSVADLFLAADLIAHPFKITELKAGGIIRNERRFKTKEGKLIEIELSARMLEDGKFIVFGHDIAERKKADKKLKESELRYRSLNEQATDAICITDASLKFLEINPYGCEIFGYTREEALQLSLPDILFTEDLTGNPLKVEELEFGKTVRNERRLKRKDGTAIDMAVSTRIMEDGRMIMFGHDITERKKAEEKLRKANRLYTFICQVDQNIVHIKDEESLFRNACQVAFEFGKFKMAWIGRFNKETEKITLVDQSGIAEEEIPLFIHTSYEKSGPQDHVLHTGTYYLCNDIEHDLELQSWKLFAARHGIQSAIVLPIKRSGQVIATFNLYAAELNFFDREEIKLLTEVAEDISFALDLFENVKKQKETEELIVKNEKRFRLLIEKSADMKTLSTPEGKLLYGSASVTKYLGYTMDELHRHSAFDLIHPDDAMDEKSIHELFDSPGKSLHMQQRILHKDGRWIWCEGSITNMLHEPAVNALVSNFRDISEKKIAEQQKEFDSVNLNALINNKSDLIWSLDREYKLIIFNQPFFDVIKLYTGKELIKGDDVFDVALSPEQVDRFKKAYIRAFSGETFTEIEHIEAPFESWSEISYYPICKGEEVIGTACHSRDITERKRAELNLVQSEKKYRQIVETAQEGIWLIDENKRTAFVNKRICEMLGYTPAEMLGKDLFYFMDDEGKQIAAVSLDIQKKSGGDNLDFKFLTKTGTTVWTYLVTSSLLDEDGSYIGGLAMVTDITERKKAEEEILHTLNEKNTILESIGDAFFAVDDNWIVTYWNNHAESMLRVSKNEIIGHHLWDIFRDSIDSESYIKYHKAVETRQMIHFEDYYQILNKWFAISAYPSESGLSVYFKDVTERKLSDIHIIELNENLQNQTRELAISNADLEQFAYVASHDLQEPLRMVTSFLTLLQKKYADVIDDKGRQYIEFAVDGAKRMRQIILDLLEFSRVGRTEDMQEDIDLNEIVDEIQILFRKQILEKKAVIALNTLPHISGFRSPIRQVFQNLVGNALKYSVKDQAVEINITCTELPDHWQFAVRDNGIGIEQEYFDKIFIIFQRLHNRDEFSGTGMGLAITKKIIENEGGRIWVESEEGIGSTFYFTIKK